MTRPLFALLLLAGCAPSISPGTSVGNPGLFAMQAAPTGEVEIVGGWAHTDRALLHDCEEHEEEVGLEPRAFGEVQELPSGAWCAIELVMIDPLELEVIVPAFTDESFVVGIPLEAMAVLAHGRFDIEEDGEYVLELGAPDWLREEHFEPVADELILRPEAEGELIEVLELGSALFVDANRNGELDEDERDVGPIAAGDPDNALDRANDEDEDSEPGSTSPDCQGGGTLAFVPWLVAPLARRRTRGGSSSS